jgi:hypothetical protein
VTREKVHRFLSWARDERYDVIVELKDGNEFRGPLTALDFGEAAVGADPFYLFEVKWVGLDV